MNYKMLNIHEWERKAHFNFFKTFEIPFFGVTFNVDVTQCYAMAKKNGQSFFISYLYAALKAANAVEAFKYRMVGANEVRVYNSIHASPTINRPDGTFGFSYINYNENFEAFYTNALTEIDRVKSNAKLEPSKDDGDTIYFSALPWLQFTSLSHAVKIQQYDSVPRISFGKVFTENTKLLMPTSVHVNHALADGYHVGLFSEHFQNNLNAFSY